MDTTRAVYFMIIALSGITPSPAADWSYSGAAGPLYWHEIFPEGCSGKYQSPIDIHPEETVYNPELKDFAIWYDPPKKDSRMYITNNGHTVQVQLDGDFYVSNAGLSSVYKAVQFHFHWGHKAHHGSEHLIDGKPSPIELHLVTYNSELYSDIAEALMEPGGLAVLGVMYEISETDNPSLAAIVKALKHVKDPEIKEKDVLPLMSLRDFLPKDLSRYYRYNGSLTTPGCFESVIWTVFDAKQTISQKQLKEFTSVLQFKRKHTKEEHARHRRSLTKGEKDKERRAKYVLDELGIRGNAFEESRLQSELMHEMMMGDQAHDKTADNAVTRISKDTGRLDEKSVVGSETPDAELLDDFKKLAEAGMFNSGVLDSTQKVPEAAPLNSKQTDEVAVVDDAYIQETIINNFRPVQPLNDRTVYRSFKNVCVVAPQDVHSHRPQPVQASKEDSQGGKNSCAKLDNPSTVVILLILIRLFQ